VDEGPAHEGLGGSIDILDIDALFEDLFSINRDELLGDTRNKRGVHRADFLALARSGHELSYIRGKELDILARAILQHKRESTRCTYAGNCGWGEGERDTLRKARDLFVDGLPDKLVLLFSFLAVLPFLQCDEEKCAVGRAREAQKTETDNARAGFHPRCLRQHVFDLVSSGFRPLQR